MWQKKMKKIDMYNQTSLIQTPKGQNQVSALQRCLFSVPACVHGVDMELTGIR